LAQIANIVLELLSPLFLSPMGELAQAAVSRVNSEADVEGSIRELTPREQLEVVNTVIAGSLKRELLLIAENREMIGSLRERYDGGLLFRQRRGIDDDVPIDGIKVLWELPEGQYREEDLISDQRQQAVLHLLKAWGDGVAEARRQLETGDDDSR